MLHTASAPLPMLLWKSEFAPASRNHPWSSLRISSSQLTVQRTHLVGQIPALRLHVSLESHLACLAQWLCFSFLSFLFFFLILLTHSFIWLCRVLVAALGIFTGSSGVIHCCEQAPERMGCWLQCIGLVARWQLGS